MKSEPSISQKQVFGLLSLMGDDEEMRRKMADVLRSELAGPEKAKAVHQDIGRLRR